MAETDFKPGFLRTLLVLREYLPEIVIGGGWVPLIYYHYLVKDKSLEPMRTKDIDLVVPKSVPVVGPKSIDELLVESGLKADLGGRHNPPPAYYEGQIDGHEVEIQFLTHHAGAGPNKTIKVQEGLNALALRYISLLLDDPIDVEIDELYLAARQPISVRVPRPGAYIFHKGLVFQRRAEALKKAKDLYYIFDILANCPQLRDQIIDEISTLKDRYPAKWFKDFKRNLQEGFGELASSSVKLVAGQRPSDAFPDLDDAQFKRFVLGTFQEFIESF